MKEERSVSLYLAYCLSQSILFLRALLCSLGGRHGNWWREDKDGLLDAGEGPNSL